jgi:deoxyribose-phosphate aldolase
MSQLELEQRIRQAQSQFDATAALNAAATSPVALAPAVVAAMIDHTLLKPEAGEDGIRLLCAEALAYNFASVCVNPTWVPLCVELLAGSPVKVCTVIGFPLGATLPAVKAYEAEQVIDLGATEVDMVLPVGRLRDGDYLAVYRDISDVVDVAHDRQIPVKVILETGLLTDAQKIAACVISADAGADFVKTSTGFSGGGATAADIALMRQIVGPTMGVKASGGVRTAADALRLIAAGATRIGASAGVKIVAELGGEQVRPAAGDGY